MSHTLKCITRSSWWPVCLQQCHTCCLLHRHRHQPSVPTALLELTGSFLFHFPHSSSSCWSLGLEHSSSSSARSKPLASPSPSSGHLRAGGAALAPLYPRRPRCRPSARPAGPGTAPRAPAPPTGRPAAPDRRLRLLRLPGLRPAPPRPPQPRERVPAAAGLHVGPLRQ